MKTLYNIVQSYQYKDGWFSAGLVKNSEHKINKIYLQVKETIFDLRRDEAYAILSTLSTALWTEYQLMEKDKKKLKWITREKLP